MCSLSSNTYVVVFNGCALHSHTICNYCIFSMNVMATVGFCFSCGYYWLFFMRLLLVVFHAATIEGQCLFDSRIDSFSKTVNITELTSYFYVLINRILGNECVCLMDARL